MYSTGGNKRDKQLEEYLQEKRSQSYQKKLNTNMHQKEDHMTREERMAQFKPRPHLGVCGPYRRNHRTNMSLLSVAIAAALTALVLLITK